MKGRWKDLALGGLVVACMFILIAAKAITWEAVPNGGIFTVSCSTTTATSLRVKRDRRTAIMIKNNSSYTIHVATSAITATTAGGSWPLSPSGVISDDMLPLAKQLYALGTTSACEVKVWENWR